MLDRRQRRTDACHLRLGLVTASENAERARTLPREVARSDAACRSGSEPPELVGLDHGDQLGLRSVEEADDEGRSRRGGRIQLSSGQPELAVRSGHVGERALLELEAPSRSVVDDTTRHPLEALLDRPDGVGRRKKRGDIRFGQVQRHRASL